MQAAFPVRNGQDAERLFAGMPCLQGLARAAVSGMGRVWTDRPLRPACAVAAVGDFILCGGEPGPSATHMLRVALASASREWLAYAPGRWEAALAQTATMHHETRWGFRHDVQPADERLLPLAALPRGVTVQPIAGTWIEACARETWSRDFVREFGTTEAYAESGLGVLLMMNGRPVAGASSYVAYPGGIEAQVQTREGFEGRGLATIAAARLILTAHEKGLQVSWDAANAASAHIAKKLGYASAGAYSICVVQK